MTQLQQNPLVSVIIPCLNRETLVGQAIESALGQTYQNLEIIVVNDGSTDGTEELEGDPRFEDVLWIHRIGGGDYAARNAGIVRAKGEVIAFTDDDCRPDNDWLRVIRRMFSDREVSAIFGHTYCDKAPATFIHSVINTGQITITCNMAVRRNILFDIGLFDDTFIFYFGDEDLGNRLKESPYGILYVPDMRVFHPSKYQSFVTYVRRRRGFLYLPYMHEKYREADYFRTWQHIWKRSLKRVGVYAVPVVLSIVDLRLLVSALLLFLGYSYLDFRNLATIKRECESQGIRIRVADQFLFILFNQIVPLVDGFQIVKGWSLVRLSIWRPRMRPVPGT